MRGTVEQEAPTVGVVVALEEPSRQLKTEVVGTGYHHAAGWERDYPKI